MTMTTEAILARLFWHRSRRQFVELTVTDAARRLSISEYQAGQKLTELAQNGYADHSYHKVNSDSVMLWRASTLGRNLAVSHINGGIA